MAADHLILICFDFPPNDGIGGRRWAKLSKALLKKGFFLHVIKAEPLPGRNQSPWSQEVEHPHLTTYSLPRTYPAVVDRGPQSFIEKLYYRIALCRLKTIEKGTIYDRAIGWRQPLTRQLERLLQTTNTKNVLVTGAPFNLMFYAAEVLLKHPEIRLIVDYRDPWITAENYGMATLSAKRKAIEIRKQERVFDVADFVLTPSDSMTQTAASFALERHKTTFRTLRHFFDEDDVLNSKSEVNDDKIKIVYGGALYLGLEKHLQTLAEGVRLLKQKERALFERLEITFYTPHHRFASIFSDLVSTVKFNQPIGKHFFHKVQASNAVFLFLAEHNKDFFTTKFYELLPYHKPMIFFGAEGKTSHAIQSMQLGHVHTKPLDFVNSIITLSEQQEEIPRTIDLTEFTLDYRADELIQFLKS